MTREQTDFRGGVAVITGAGSGIGAGLVTYAAGLGMRLLDLLRLRHPEDRSHLGEEEQRRDEDERVQAPREHLVPLRDEDRGDQRPRDEGHGDDDDRGLPEGREARQQHREDATTAVRGTPLVPRKGETA